MAITHELFRLGRAARRLTDGTDQLDRLLSDIDRAFGRLMLGMEYVLPRPLAEIVHHDREGKRIIELDYLGYLRMPDPEPTANRPESDEAFEPGTGYHLAIRTIKVLEGRKAADAEPPGRVTPLLVAPLALRHAAVDHLPDLVAGLVAQIDEMVGHIERRCALANSVLDTLEGRTEASE